MGKKLRAELIIKDIIDELRSFRTATIIFLTNIVLLVSVASIFYSVINSKQNGYATNYKAVLYMYNNLILMEFVAILIITPIMAGASYAKEYKQGTMKLLLLSKLKTMDILLSKIIKSVIINLFLGVTALPFLSVVFSVGGVTLWDLSKFFIVIVATTMLFGSIGTYFSVKFKSVNKAIICTYIVEIATSFGAQVILNIVYKICDKIKNRAYYSGRVGAEYDKVQFDALGNLLLGSPIFNLFKLQSDTVGNTSKFDTTMNNFGINPIIDKIWLFISICIQLVIIFFVVKKTESIMYNRHFK